MLVARSRSVAGHEKQSLLALCRSLAYIHLDGRRALHRAAVEAQYFLAQVKQRSGHSSRRGASPWAAGSAFLCPGFYFAALPISQDL